MRQKMKIILQSFVILLAIAAVIGFFIHIRFFYKAENGSQKYLASFSKEKLFPSPQRFQIKDVDALVFEVQPKNCFLLDYIDKEKKDGTNFPWQDAVFVTVAFDGGETKKLSAAKCRMLISRDGELTVAIGYNSKYFKPEEVRISTGVKDDSPTGFVAGSLLVKIRQYEPKDEIGKIPEVEDIPKQQESISSSKIETGKLQNYKKVFFGIIPLPDLSKDEEVDEKKGLLAPLSEKKQAEIIRRSKASNDEAARLWNNFFSPDKDGEEGEEK